MLTSSLLTVLCLDPLRVYYQHLHITLATSSGIGPLLPKKEHVHKQFSTQDNTCLIVKSCAL